MYKRSFSNQLSSIRNNIYTVLCTLSVAFTIIYLVVISYILTSSTIYLLACLLSGTFPSIQLVLLIVAYSCWYYFDSNSPEEGGYKANRFITLLRTKLFLPSIHYFPITLHFPKHNNTNNDTNYDTISTNLKENESYIIGYHPHGALPIGAIMPFTGCTNLLRPFIPHSIDCIRFATVPFNLRLPGWRELLLASGFIHSSFRSCIVYLGIRNEGDESVKRGKVLVIAVGGSREMLEAKNGTCNLILSSRKGIFRLALLTGASLIPTFGFNENELFHFYEGYRWMNWLREWSLERLNFTIPLIKGRYLYGLLPGRTEINVVFGNSISVEKRREEEVTEEVVEELKEKYMDELRRMYEENVQKYGDPKVPLIIK